LQQRVETVEPRLRAELEIFAVITHRVEQVTHLRQRFAPRMLYAPQRFTVLGQRYGEFVPDCADLEHHHADGVGDDVVQLARDPGAFLGHSDARGHIPLLLGLSRA
jgi:hypothetical protein